jgi:putative restriction endonuclease
VQTKSPQIEDAEILERFARLRRYAQGEFVAPNKPVTLLWSLERLERGAPRLSTFAEAEPQLRDLLGAYGAPGTNPIHAFWRLQNDGVWEVASDQALPPRAGNKEPRVSELREFASGGLSAPIHGRLVENPPLLEDARGLLESMIDSSAIDRERDPGAKEAVWRRVRAVAFRQAVRSAYDGRCVVCGWGPVHDGQALGVEAAHVRPLSAGGPDGVGNGIALCANHHALFDAGVFTWDRGRRLIVSRSWDETRSGNTAPLRLREGSLLPEPLGRAPRVDDANLRWHRTRVFRGS